MLTSLLFNLVLNVLGISVRMDKYCVIQILGYLTFANGAFDELTLVNTVKKYEQPLKNVS